MLAASLDHFAQIIRADGAGLLANDVFAGARGSDHPLLAQAGRKRNVNRVHVFCHEQCFITAQRSGIFPKWIIALTLTNEITTLFHVAAGDGGDDGIAAVENRLPVFTVDVGRA
jgi:hypothetical protein